MWLSGLAQLEEALEGWCLGQLGRTWPEGALPGVVLRPVRVHRAGGGFGLRGSRAHWGLHNSGRLWLEGQVSLLGHAPQLLLMEAGDNGWGRALQWQPHPLHTLLLLWPRLPPQISWL